MRRKQRGMALVWVALYLPFFVSIAGLVMDGGQLFKAQRDLQDVADSAARAAAMQIDQQAYRASSGATIVLDTGAAKAVGGQYITDQQQPDLTATIDAGPDAVRVQVDRDVPTAFMRVVHIDTAHVRAVAVATPRHGISAEQR